MKIVVAATGHPHALSRHQLEAVFTVLPQELKEGINEVSLETGPWHEGRCEFDAENQRLRLALVVPEKTPETTEKALRILLDGLARRLEGGRFFERARRADGSHDAIVERWLPLCLQAAS